MGSEDAFSGCRCKHGRLRSIRPRAASRAARPYSAYRACRCRGGRDAVHGDKAIWSAGSKGKQSGRRFDAGLATARPTDLVLCHLKHAQFRPCILESEVVLIVVGLLVGGRLQVFDLAHPDPAPREDLSCILRQLSSRKHDQRVRRSLVDERLVQDESAGEVAPLGQQGGVRLAVAVGAMTVAIAVCDGHGRMVSSGKRSSRKHDLGPKARRSDRRDRGGLEKKKIDRHAPSFPRLRSPICHEYSIYEREIRAA